MHIQRTDREIAEPASQPTACVDGFGFPLIESDASTVEQGGYVAAGVTAERKCSGVLKKELSLLREEEIEPCQVDTFFVRLDLCEVGRTVTSVAR